tara:strand:- start:980 stop:1324 length:345 start_codon:yes stop_codon:yes gene_type:complete
MNHVNFRIEKEAHRIIVRVEVVEQKMYPLVPIVQVTTEDVEEYLRLNGIKTGALIIKGTAHNKRNNSRHGTWVFKKALDKPAKQVILKKEKPVRPKPTRKKRTRSSTKKVSTED